MAIPATVAGIAAGSLAAPALVSAFGLSGALITCGVLALAYGLFLIGRRPAPAPAATPGTCNAVPQVHEAKAR